MDFSKFPVQKRGAHFSVYWKLTGQVKYTADRKDLKKPFKIN